MLMKPIEIAECIEVMQGLLDKDFFNEPEKIKIKSLVMALVDKMAVTEELIAFIKETKALPVKKTTPTRKVTTRKKS